MIEIEAIVLDLDGGDALEELLDSIASQTVPFRRVHLFDNGSAVPVERRITRRDLPLAIARSATNLGFTGGVNAVMPRIDSPLVALLNNDVRLSPVWNERLAARFASPAVAAVQAINLRPDGTVDGAGITIAGGRFRQRGHGLAPRDVPPVSSDLFGVSLTAAMLRAEAVREVAMGGCTLHPDLFAWYEDVELAARLARADWKAELVEEPLAVHRGSMTAERIVQAERLRGRNRYIVARLHPGVGRIHALLAEDLRRGAAALVRGEIRLAAAIAAGAREGLLRRLSPAGRFV